MMDKNTVTPEEIAEELKRALKEKDEPGIGLLKMMLIAMGAREDYPELFL